MTKAKNILIWIGGLALLAATTIDTLAVIGRQIGEPFTGSIELMQAVVLVSGSVGLLVATIDQSHARVHLLVDRLTGTARRVADGLSDALTLIFLLALVAGSVWIAAELWNGHEQSELLGVPWRVLRLIASAALLGASVVLLWRILRVRSA